MYRAQNGLCYICKKPESKINPSGQLSALSVDHDHETGKVRGLLCNRCNIGIAIFSENRDIFRSAMNYLIRHKTLPSWDEYFLDIAQMASSRSKDPSTKVGALIVKDKKIIATGYNGLPRQMDDTNPKFWERPEKYVLIIHAEMNAMLQTTSEYARGSTLYTTLFPCSDCAKTAAQYGIKEIVYMGDDNPRFKDSFEKSKQILDNCGVVYRKYA
jgi:deoxycytidylate deaminase